MTKPLPCVFCGKRPVASFAAHPGRLSQWSLTCVRTLKNASHTLVVWGKTEQIAIERWNREFGLT